MSSSTFSIRLPDEQKTYLDAIAEATKSTRNQLISSAVSKMIENYKFVLSKIEQGDADIAAGRVVSMEESKLRTQGIIDRARQSQAL